MEIENPYSRTLLAEPRSLRPVQQAKPGPLSYYVTAPTRPEDVVYGPADVTACTDWARREASSRSAQLDVREASTGAVFFSFDPKGAFVL